MLRIAKALYAWGMVDADERILRLKEALDKAVEDIIENQGKEITQGNVGDSSFQFAPGSMTVDLWVEALGLAIRSLEHGRFEIPGTAAIRPGVEKALSCFQYKPCRERIFQKFAPS